MSRKTPNPSPRIAKLEAARKTIRRKLIVNGEDLSKIVGLTWRRLRDLVEADPEWPVIRKGSEGVSYEFDAKAVLDHMIRRAKEQMVGRHKRADRIATMSGVLISPELLAQDQLSINDLRTIDTLQTSAQRRKIEQRHYVRRDEAEAVITDLFSTMQAETMATVSRLDPAGRWPSQVRAEVAEAVRGLLVTLHDKVGDWLKPDAGPKAGTRGRAKPARQRPLLRKRA